jgi:hypothetical protein
MVNSRSVAPVSAAIAPRLVTPSASPNGLPPPAKSIASYNAVKQGPASLGNVPRFPMHYRNEPVEDALFGNDIIYRVMFHPAYIIEEMRHAARGEQTPRPACMPEEQHRLQREMLEDFLPIIATSINVYAMPQNYQPNHRRTAILAAAAASSTAVTMINARASSNYVQLLPEPDARRIMEYLQQICLNHNHTYRFRFLFLCALHREETLQHYVVKMCNAQKYQYLMRLLQLAFDPEGTGSEYMAQINTENAFSAIVNMILEMAQAYMTMPRILLSQDVRQIEAQLRHDPSAVKAVLDLHNARKSQQQPQQQTADGSEELLALEQFRPIDDNDDRDALAPAKKRTRLSATDE